MTGFVDRPATAFARSVMAAGLVAAAMAGGCADAVYQGRTPFSCEVDRQCPTGFICQSDLCIRPSDTPPPPLLARSSSPFSPRTLPDPDRGGTVTCWTVAEDATSEQAAVYATFADASGAIRSVTRLVTLDARETRYRGACAPIPNTQGQILVSLWMQSAEIGGTAQPLRGAPTVTQMRLLVWTPSTALGTSEGTARPFYTEVSPDRDPTPSLALELDIVGDKVWVPLVWSLGIPPNPIFRFGAELAIQAVAIGADEVRSGRVLRYDLARTRSAFLDTSARVRTGASGTWISVSRTRTLLGFATPSGGRFIEVGATADNLMLPLVGTRITSGMSTSEQLAVLWPDALENNGAALYRVAWFRPFAIAPSVGPRLPFRRVETPEPAAVVIDSDLYVIGSPVGEPVPPLGLDGGMIGDAAADASDTGLPSRPSDAGMVSRSAVLGVYKIPWGADSAATPELLQRIESRAADAQVVSASAARIPGQPRAIQLAWVEYYPPDGGRRGARYALYSSRVNLR